MLTLGATGMMDLAQAKELHLKWSLNNLASGYRLYHSTDGGQTWTLEADQNIPDFFVDAPENGDMVFYMAANYNQNAEVRRPTEVIAYNSAWSKLQDPKEFLIE